MRILITGSRTWWDLTRIRAVLYRTAAPYGAPVVIVSGASRGADAYCEYVARSVGWTVERHPADWERLGKRAGFVRNAEMVALGADVCLAFIRDNSRGATMTADLAERAGIPTYRHHQVSARLNNST